MISKIDQNFRERMCRFANATLRKRNIDDWNRAEDLASEACVRLVVWERQNQGIDLIPLRSAGFRIVERLLIDDSRRASSVSISYQDFDFLEDLSSGPDKSYDSAFTHYLPAIVENVKNEDPELGHAFELLLEGRPFSEVSKIVYPDYEDTYLGRRKRMDKLCALVRKHGDLVQDALDR